MRRRVVRLLAIMALAGSLLAATAARRLTRYEYDCSVRDLLGVDFREGNDFPADNFSFGFDNNAGALTVTPALLSRYLQAAKTIARAAVEMTPPPSSAELERHGNPSSLRDITWRRNFIWEGDYDLHIAIAGPKDPFLLYLAVDSAADAEARRLDISGDFEGRRYADTLLHVGAGLHTVRVFAVPKDDPSQSSAYPEHLELRGPYGPVLPAMPAGYRLVFTCGHAPGQHTPACLRTNLAALARRAWRRPVMAAEIDRLMGLLAQEHKGSDKTSQAVLQQEMETGIEAMLVSPSFLFRLEGAANQPKDLELASRLSYFLWSSLPDEELLRAAERGQLSDPAALEAQARRMLADPKAAALAENFAAQWLEFRNLDFVHRDPKRFPRFTHELSGDMRRETEMFVAYVIHENRSLLDFLDGKYTFVNEPMAKLYGIPGVTGEAFRKVDLTGTPRAGILTQASVLTVTSYATRTSPVLRGKWILENILNDPPAPPPANVPALRDSASEPTLTLRQQLEEHRANPACASCHARMDTLGFGLENFDAIGRWRIKDEALAIDVAGTLPDGSSFSNPDEMVSILARRPGAFAECVAGKLMIYALGHGPDDADRSAVRQIAKDLAARNYRFSDLILGIVGSAAFRSAGGS